MKAFRKASCKSYKLGLIGHTFMADNIVLLTRQAYLDVSMLDELVILKKSSNCC